MAQYNGLSQSGSGSLNKDKKDRSFNPSRSENVESGSFKNRNSSVADQEAAQSTEGNDHKSIASQGIEAFPGFGVIEKTLKDITTNLSAARDKSIEMLKKYPFYAIAGAVALGFAAGMSVRAKRGH